MVKIPKGKLEDACGCECYLSNTVKNARIFPRAMTPKRRLMTHDYLTGLIVGLIGVAFAILRTFNNSQDLLIRLQNPGELFAFGRNPELARHGFPSGTEITAQSLPLRLYQLLAYSPIDLEIAFRVVTFIEIIFFGVCIWCAVVILHPAVRKTIVGLCVFIGLQGTIFSHNLANWGFLFGWNYGFAYGVLMLILVFGLRGKWPHAVVAIAFLLAIHPTLGVHGVLALAPIALCKKAWQNRNIVSLKVISVVTLCTTYILLSRNTREIFNSQLNTELYLRLVRVFQFHLFYDFDLRTLALFCSDFAGWSLALSVLIFVIASWRENRTAATPSSVQYIQLLWVISFSIFGWWHSQLESASTAVLLLAPHRISVVVVLLFVVVAIPRLVEPTGSRRNSVTALLVIMWALVQDQAIQASIGLLIISVLSSIWISSDYQFSFVNRAIGLIISGMTGILQLYSLRQVAWRYPRVLLLAIVAIFCTSIALRLLDVKRGRSNLLIRIQIIFSVLVAVGLSIQMTIQTRIPQDVKVNDLTKVAKWARDQTPSDSIFLLPPEDFGFGWRAVSERATAGLPREWLHYSFLYLRSQDRMMLGLATAKTFGVDAAAWTRKSNSLYSGARLVGEIADNFRSKSNIEIADLARRLKATHLILQTDQLRIRDCFQLVFVTETYFVVELSMDDCISKE